MYRNGTIELKLKYPIKFGFIQMNLSRNIGFCFDMQSLFNVLQNNDIDLPNHSKWLKETEKSVVVAETIFGAAQSYCIKNRKKDNFTKKGLIEAFNNASDDVKKSLIDCYMQSEQLGIKKMPGKKKVEKR